MAEPVQLIELALADEHRLFSPFCFRVRLALCHKGLSFTSTEMHYADKPKIAPYDKWPVLECKGRRMNESMDIIKFLDETFPDKPQLLSHGDPGVSFMQDWVGTALGGPIFPLVMLDVWRHLHTDDQEYWRSSREARIGKTLEEFCADQGEKIKAFREALQPMRTTLERYRFLGGEAPCIADILVFSMFLWAKAVVSATIVEKGDPVAAWHGRMKEHYADCLQGLLQFPGC